MSIQAPSQYNCNNMKQGDVVVITSPSISYKLFRKWFLKDKIKITFRKDWSDNPEYITAYQEDCLLIFASELLCNQQFLNEVPYSLNYRDWFKQKGHGKLKALKVGGLNLQLVFPDNISVTIPLDKVIEGIRKNDLIKAESYNNETVEEKLKFKRYDGKYFQNFVKDNNITQWKASFCGICGEAIIFNFYEDVIKLSNNCTCKNMTINIKEMTYDELAVWYYSQVNEFVIKRCDDFWFRKV